MAEPPRKAPSFTLPDTNGNFHDITDHRGKVVILTLMRTNCPHCASFSKVLEQINQQYSGRVQVFSIANPPDTLDLLKQYIAAAKITFPVLMDCGQAAFSYVRTGSVNLPRVWLIDRAGFIQQDVTYSEPAKPFFEKRGIFAELDKILAASPAAAKPAKK